VKKLIADLNKLTNKELLEIRKRIDYKLQQPLKDSSDEELFYSILTGFLKVMVVVSTPPYTIFKKNIAHKKFSECVISINLYISQTLGDNVKRVQKMQVYRLFCELITNELKELKVVVCLKSIIGIYDRFPGLVEKHFPGYIESNLFHIILNSKGGMDEN